MQMHVMTLNDDEIVVEIDKAVLMGLLRTKTGKDLSDAVQLASVTIGGDPRFSALDDIPDVFFSHYDAVNNPWTMQELLEDLESLEG